MMVNCAVIGMSDLSQRWFPDIGVAERVIFIVLMEVSYNIATITHHGRH